MRTERWWLGGFLVLSALVHILLALHGPGFGLKGYTASTQEIELTLESLPPVPKPKIVPPKPKMAAKPKPEPLPRALPKPIKERVKIARSLVKPTTTPKATPKVALKPLENEKPTLTSIAARPAPQLHMAKMAPRVKSAVAQPTHTLAPEQLPEQPLKTASTSPRFSHNSVSMPMANPLADLAATNDRPQMAAAQTNSPRLTRRASARSGLAGGASGGGHSAARGAALPTEQPSPESGLPGGMHFPRMAAHVGGESVLSVNNPLAAYAVPQENPGFSSGAGGTPGLNGKMFASLRSGRGYGLGGGLGGGRGNGSGHGTGSGLGLGHGTGAGLSGSGSGSSVETPGDGAGYGGVGHGSTSGGGSVRVASGGGAFGDVGGLLRGEPPRAPGDGRPGTGGHGLSAEIYEGQPYLAKLVNRRTDAEINFDWGTTAAIVQGVSRLFSVRWTGEIEPKYSETYTFVSAEDDGIMVWIDGQPVISDWVHHKTTIRRGSVTLQAGRKYPIKIEYFENGIGGAEVHLRWASPSQPLEVVPESALYQAP